MKRSDSGVADLGSPQDALARVQACPGESAMSSSDDDSSDGSREEADDDSDAPEAAEVAGNQRRETAPRETNLDGNAPQKPPPLSLESAAHYAHLCCTFRHSSHIVLGRSRVQCKGQRIALDALAPLLL